MTNLYYLSSDKSAWKRRGFPDIPTGTEPPPPPGGAAFSVHVPNRVILGMNANDNPSLKRPAYDEALDILGAAYQPYVRHTYANGGNWFSSNAWRTEIAETEARGMIAWPSPKVPGNNWAAVAAGTYDADLLSARNWIKTKRVSAGGNGKPFMLGVHHEPDGDGDLAEWRDMQIHLMNWFSGWDTGSYVAANDVTDLVTFAYITNGKWWGPSEQSKIDTVYTPTMVETTNRTRSLACVDIYDGATANRCNLRMSRYRAEMRTLGINYSGIGEFGTKRDAAEIQRCWAELRANRNFWAVALWYNALGGFEGDPRLIPANYPIYFPDNPLDQGGDAVSEQMLVYFRQMLTESVSAQYTSPV